MVNFFDGPIPGQSLTDIPGNSPWERPSEYNTVEEVTDHYIKKFSDEDVMDDMAILFRIGADLKSVVGTTMTMGAMKGLHTVEAGMLAGPKIASFMKAALKTYGIDAKETIQDPEEMSKRREEDRLKKLLAYAIQQSDGKEEDKGLEMLREMGASLEEASEKEGKVPLEAAPTESTKVEAKPQGLMAKGNM